MGNWDDPGLVAKGLCVEYDALSYSVLRPHVTAEQSDPFEPAAKFPLEKRDKFASKRNGSRSREPFDRSEL